jgi:ferredoxin
MNTSDGKSTLKDSTEKKGFYIAIVSDDELEDNLEAANICPVNIIRVEKV